MSVNGFEFSDGKYIINSMSSDYTSQLVIGKAFKITLCGM
jgi:hypothetical protein